MLVSQDKGHSNLLLSLKSPQPTLNLTRMTISMQTPDIR